MAGLPSTTISSSSSSSSSVGSAISSSLIAPLPPLVGTINKVTSGSHRPSLSTAKDSLAVASVVTAASLPLMIGGRSKCVFNVLDQPKSTCHHQQQQQQQHQHLIVGAKNTAIRAEQRSRASGAVSVVRPVVSSHPIQDNQSHHTIENEQNKLADPDYPEGCMLSNEPFSDHFRKMKPFPSQLEQKPGKILPMKKISLLDELMNSEERSLGAASSIRGLHQNPVVQIANGASSRLAYSNYQIDEAERYNANVQRSQFEVMRYDELQLRQQANILRREEFELNRHIKRQHRFVSLKIEDRKRSLQIVRCVWSQKDFKHSIEKLIDLYQQGLVFTCSDDNFNANSNNQQHQMLQGGSATLSSLNNGIVADVLSVILLRPKLWSLEICQLLLPVIVGDLLIQDATRYENYVELALKSLKLIVTHFAQLIRTTLDEDAPLASNNLTNPRQFSGVDLTREDRVEKCRSCKKYLLEARKIISAELQRQKGTKTADSSQAKIMQLYREVSQMLNCLNAQASPASGQVAQSSGNATSVTDRSGPLHKK